MAKLNQILAIEKGEKNKSFKALSELHHKSEKVDLYEGRVRTYTPAADDGEALPPETQVVQQTADDVLRQLTEVLTPLFDITAAKDYTNGKSAYADVVVNGRTVLQQVPVSYLLFLEKQLVDVETFISKLPTLDASQKWAFDENQKCYTTEKSWQNRTKKVMRNHTLSPATDKHPAQVQVYQEDQVIGKFESIRQSGALSVTKKESLLARVRELKNAVLFAREQANSVDAPKQEVAKSIFGFLLNG